MSSKKERKLIEIFLMLFAIVILIAFTTYDSYADELPNLKLTPGVARDVTVETLCTTSTKLVRLTTQATKATVYKEYGITPKHDPSCTGPSHSCFEIDHLIALEMGGADDINNLWPQEYEVIPADSSWQKNGAHLKDKAENEAHKRICNHSMTMEYAQHAIATDWVKFYNELFPAK